MTTAITAIVTGTAIVALGAVNLFVNYSNQRELAKTLAVVRQMQEQRAKILQEMQRDNPGLKIPQLAKDKNAITP